MNRRLLLVFLALFVGTGARAEAVDLPTGYPTWPENERASLRAKGQDVLQAIRDASAAHRDTLVIPPGDYLFHADWSRASTLRDLADLEIVAEGVTFWFEPPLVHGLLFENCRNVTVRGLVIDSTMPCWFQARVADVDRTAETIRATIMEGYEPRAANGTPETEGSRALIFYKADGRFLNHRHSPGSWRLSPDGRGRPATSRLHAFGADVFHLANTDRGPTLEQCELAYGADDLLNIHGSFGRVVARQDDHHYFLEGAYEVGDVIEFWDQREIMPLGTATVVAATPTPTGPTARINDRSTARGECLVQLDRPLALPILSLIVMDGKRSASGFVVRECWMHDTFQRVLINGAPGGLIENNTFENLGHGLEIQFETWGPWMEGPFARDLQVRNNRFRTAPPAAPAIIVSMHPPHGNSYVRRFVSTPVTNMTITGNSFTQASAPTLEIHNVKGLTICDNTFDLPADASPTVRPGQTSNAPWYALQDCEEVHISGNTVTPSARTGAASGPEPPAVAEKRARPNIVWFVVDDMSADLSCYRPVPITTPHLDRLAREGTRFTHAYTTAPVCSPSRSAMITGMYQTAIGAHHHRSGRGVRKIQLPDGVRPVPVLFQQAGYYTCVGDGLANDDDRADGKKRHRLGKTDYNFEWDPKMYDGEDWAGRAAGQPFFMQVMLPGGKLRAERLETIAAAATLAARTLGSSVRPEDVVLPPYLPRDPVLLADWAAYLDSVRLTDHHVGQVLARLENEGVLDETLVIFMTDHGISHARAKQFLYDEGTHIPFIVRGPDVPRGGVRDDFVEQIDMAPTSLAAAGIPIPASMQGRDLFATDAPPRDAVFAARDRCDETVDKIRSVRTDRFLYIRNFYPNRPLLQPNAYKDNKAPIEALRRLHAAGELLPLAERLLFSPTRPPEELYLWREDPWQLTNLADDPDYRLDLEACRGRLDRWMRDMRDPPPETEAEYDSDMAAYVGKGNPVVERNIAAMKRQAAAERDQQPAAQR